MTKFEKGDVVFTQEEIESLKSSIMSVHSRNAGKTLWMRAFEYYNNYNSPRLSLMCRPCYPKVLIYILSTQTRF